MMSSDKLRHQWHMSTNALVNEITIELHQHKVAANTTSVTAISKANNNSNSIISSVSQKWYDTISHHYNEPHRAYHNLIHVEDVLNSIDTIIDAKTIISDATNHDCNGDRSMTEKKNRAILTLAAFFHDVIYNPKSSTNEKDSADLFLVFVSELYCVIATLYLGNEWKDDNIRQLLELSSASKTTMIAQIKQCILATETHIASANLARLSHDTTTDAAVAIFLDADMSILGSRDPIRYDKYAASIRKEYEFVEHQVYCTKRAEILESFLPLMMKTDDEADGTTETTTSSSSSASSLQSIEKDRKEKQHDYIYATARGIELWEERARQNLRREIDMLRRGIIPCER